jgi:hypothetical protein
VCPGKLRKVPAKPRARNASASNCRNIEDELHDYRTPLAGASILPRNLQRLTARHEALLQAIGATIDHGTESENPLLRGCAVAPYAGFAVAATSLRRPLLFAECNLIAEMTGNSMLLMRFDADKGVSFDVLLGGSRKRLCHHLAWRTHDGPLWLIPTAGKGPHVQASGWSLDPRETPPFTSTRQRDAGIIRAIDNPTSSGECRASSEQVDRL